MKWFKFYGQDFLTDSKMRILTLEEKMCWVVLMCLANSEDKDGNIFYVTEEEVMKQAGVDKDGPSWDKTLGFLDKFQDLEMIKISVTNVTSRVTDRYGALHYDITLRNFNLRQSKNLSSAERQKKYRERLKIKTELVEGKRNNRYVTLRNDRDARTEKKRTEEREGTPPLTGVPLILNVGPTPSQIAKEFFTGGAIYAGLMNEFSDNSNRKHVESEFKKFVLYWTEPNKSGTKQRWEQQQTFEVKRRLVTWLSRSKEWAPKTSKNEMSVASEIKL